MIILFFNVVIPDFTFFTICTKAPPTAFDISWITRVQHSMTFLLMVIRPWPLSGLCMYFISLRNITSSIFQTVGCTLPKSLFFCIHIPRQTQDEDSGVGLSLLLLPPPSFRHHRHFLRQPPLSRDSPGRRHQDPGLRLWQRRRSKWWRMRPGLPPGQQIALCWLRKYVGKWSKTEMHFSPSIHSRMPPLRPRTQPGSSCSTAGLRQEEACLSWGISRGAPPSSPLWAR